MKTKKQLRDILLVACYILLGLLLLKFIPIYIWGETILFDASMHLSSAIFVLYVCWYFIDQNKEWRIPYLIFSLVVLSIISTQRILVDAHNDIGLLLGLVLGVGAIMLTHRRYFRKKLRF
tara:strand:+ start:143 stop:502 length:360 start_codon:yes stop_codon:yes gene_type:complete